MLCALKILLFSSLIWQTVVRFAPELSAKGALAGLALPCFVSYVWLMRITCTRKLEFDAAHRVEKHGGKCSSLHGHRYMVEITCSGSQKPVGYAIDFGQIKVLVGDWIDRYLDHTTIYHEKDEGMATLCKLHAPLLEVGAIKPRSWYAMKVPPTAENIAALLLEKASELLRRDCISVDHVRVYETPNCFADAYAVRNAEQQLSPKKSAGQDEDVL